MSSTAGAVKRRLATGVTPEVQRQLVSTLLVTLAVLFAALAAFLLLRRLIGALDRPLGAPVVIIAALVAELGAFTLRTLLPHTKFNATSTARTTRLQPLLAALPTVCAICVLAALTLPGTPAWGMAFAWPVLIVGEAAHWLPVFRPSLFCLRSVRTTAVPATHPAATEEPEIPSGLVQQITRVRETNRESLHALVRAEIPRGDQLAVVHLSFCPPLDSRPELTAHALDADNADVRITQAETFGARLEIRSPRAEAAARQVLIEVLGSITDLKDG